MSAQTQGSQDRLPFISKQNYFIFLPLNWRSWVEAQFVAKFSAFCALPLIHRISVPVTKIATSSASACTQKSLLHDSINKELNTQLHTKGDKIGNFSTSLLTTSSFSSTRTVRCCSEFSIQLTRKGDTSNSRKVTPPIQS